MTTPVTPIVPSVRGLWALGRMLISFRHLVWCGFPRRAAVCARPPQRCGSKARDVQVWWPWIQLASHCAEKEQESFRKCLRAVYALAPCCPESCVTADSVTKAYLSSNGILDRCTEGHPKVSGPSFAASDARYSEIMAERERANATQFIKKKALRVLS